MRRYELISREHYRWDDQGRRRRWRHWPACHSCLGTGVLRNSETACSCGEWASEPVRNLRRGEADDA